MITDVNISPCPRRAALSEKVAGIEVAGLDGIEVAGKGLEEGEGLAWVS